MEITSWNIYWLLMLDNLHGPGIRTIAIFAAILTIVSAFMYQDSFFEKKRSAIRKIWAICIPFVLFVVMVNLFLPTTKQMAAIIIAPPIINNEKVQQIPSDLLDIIGLSMDRLKEELDVSKIKKD